MNPFPWLSHRGARLLISSALLVGGCATELDWPKRQALDSLVGRSQRDVTGALGPPSRSFRDGPASLLAYDYHHVEFIPGEYGEQDPMSADLWLVTPALVNQYCSTTFKLVDDAVVGWSLRGNDCSLAPYPALGALEQQVLARLQPVGVAASTDFIADPNTGVSAVPYGVFQSR